MNTIIVILLIGASQGLLLSLVLFSTRRGNRLANRLLALKLLLFSIIIFLNTLENVGYKSLLSDQAVLEHSFLFLFGPLIYFYARSLTFYHFKLKINHILHLIPYFLSVPLILVFFIFSHDYQTAADLLIDILMAIHIFVYYILTIILLRKHAEYMKENFSSLEKINLNWLRFLLIGYAVIWAISLFLSFLLEGSAMEEHGWNLLWICLSVLIYSIGYMGLRQPEIFTGPMEPQTMKKYSKSSLTPETAEKNLIKLNRHMKTRKPHLDNNITLSGLSGQLAISTHHLSQIINDKLGQNFFEFISYYRVEEAKKNLTDPEKINQNIATIGLESGFNSISAFNAAFKKMTGLTPSQYKETTLKNAK